MDYINEYSILSMMSRTSYQEGALVGSRGFYRGRRKATVFCYPLDDVKIKEEFSLPFIPLFPCLIPG